MSEKIDLKEAFASFDETWTPKVIGEVSGHLVKLSKTEGEFVWHSHADEDELFLVVEGELVLELRDKSVTLGPGQMYVVPRGVEHKPIGSASVLVFEPGTTRNTGEVENEYTVEPANLERL